MAKDKELRRAQLKKSALMRAEFNAKVALARIDFNLNELEPEIEKIELEAPTKGLPEFEVTDD